MCNSLIFYSMTDSCFVICFKCFLRVCFQVIFECICAIFLMYDLFRYKISSLSGGVVIV